MEKIFIVAAMLLTVSSAFAKNVVPVYTSCGEVGYIDTERTTMDNTMEQVMEIEHALCGD